MHSPAKSIKHAKYIYINIYNIYVIYYFQILDLISWHLKTNLFCTLIYLTIIKKSMKMLEVPKPSYNLEVPT
jgi:hypothetical protein